MNQASRFQFNEPCVPLLSTFFRYSVVGIHMYTCSVINIYISGLSASFTSKHWCRCIYIYMFCYKKFTFLEYRHRLETLESLISSTFLVQKSAVPSSRLCLVHKLSVIGIYTYSVAKNLHFLLIDVVYI